MSSQYTPVDLEYGVEAVGTSAPTQKSRPLVKTILVVAGIALAMGVCTVAAVASGAADGSAETGYTHATEARRLSSMQPAAQDVLEIVATPVKDEGGAAPAMASLEQQRQPSSITLAFSHEPQLIPQSSAPVLRHGQGTAVPVSRSLKVGRITEGRRLRERLGEREFEIELNQQHIEDNFESEVDQQKGRTLLSFESPNAAATMLKGRPLLSSARQSPRNFAGAIFDFEESIAI